MKKILAILVAVMILAASVSALAEATNYTIKLPSSLTGATYDIYQILTGKYNKDKNNKETLSDVHWGSSTGKSGELTEAQLKTITGLADGKPETARKLFDTYCTGSAFKTAEIAGAEVSVPEGYYLIKETLPTGTAAEGQEQSLYVVEVVGNVTITRKASETTSDKTTDDVNDSTGTTEANRTSSDYDIGDDVPYHVSAKISEKVGQYPKYHLTFVDTLESGCFDSISALDIKMDGAALADTDDYTVKITGANAATKDGFNVTITFTPKTDKDLSSLHQKEITIDFTAKLGEGAQIGAGGNSNTLKVKYSNNPNSSDDKDEGETPEHKVVTFTYKVVVDKTDDQDKPLPGAGFTLYKIHASHNAAKTGDAAAQNAAWASDNISVVGTYNKGTTFTFAGIDDGTYVLCETTTPAGYNTIKPIVFTVNATHTDEAITELSGTGDIKFTANTQDGSLKTSVVNKGGATLPETGGIGTTIFYVAGSILVLAAVVLLVTKRRMNAGE